MPRPTLPLDDRLSRLERALAASPDDLLTASSLDRAYLRAGDPWGRASPELETLRGQVQAALLRELQAELHGSDPEGHLVVASETDVRAYTHACACHPDCCCPCCHGANRRWGWATLERWLDEERQQPVRALGLHLSAPPSARLLQLTSQLSSLAHLHASRQAARVDLIPLRGLTHLEELDVRQIATDGPSLTALRELRSLRRLDLGFEENPTSVLEAMAALPRLREVYLRAGTRITDHALGQLSATLSLEQLVSCTGQPWVTGDGLEPLAEAGVPLRMLALNCRYSEAGLFAVGGLKTLETLHVRLGRDQDQARSLQTLCADLQRLRKLVLRDASAASDSDLCALAAATALEDLSVYDGAQAGPATCAALAELPLRGLTLDACSDVTDREVALLSRCWSLRALNLYGCAVTPEGLAPLTRLYLLTRLGVRSTRLTRDLRPPEPPALVSGFLSGPQVRLTRAPGWGWASGIP